MAEKAKTWPGEARQEFLRHFFHDLATPLSAVALHLEGADRRVRRGADPSEPLAIARAELAKAFELFEEARECLLAPGESPETFAFDDFVSSMIPQDRVQPIAVEGVTGGYVTAPRRALSEALLALVSNALEASPRASISVRRGREDGRLYVLVENPGRLAAEDPETLFAPRAARAGRNWGMGLPRARLLAAAAGATVRLQQRADRVAATLEVPEASI